MIFTNFREIDGAGRIVISKDIRNHLNIKAGDMLHIEADNDCITCLLYTSPSPRDCS